MTKENSYQQILKSSSVIGGASVINILISLLRTKMVAIILGPAGVGLMGLFINVVGVVSGVAGLGFGNVGTRQIAEAAGQDDPRRIALARRALFWGTLVLACLGGASLWLLRELIARRVLDDATLAPQIGWLSCGVALTIASASQNALLNGLRRIADIARVQIGSAVLSTTLGLLALWWFGEAGLVAFVVAAPLASFLLGHWFVARLPKVEVPKVNFRELTTQWSSLARLGVAFMVAGLAGVVGQLLVRTLVQRELGPEALGQFQAAWVISMTYIGFVLGAMGTDFYPRLTGVIRDHDAVNRLVNEQSEVALLLAAPVLLAMSGLAPLVMRILYTSEFTEAAQILRWQVLGDFIKVASWPLGFILLASGAGRTYMMTEWTSMTSFALFTWLGLPFLGVTVTGVAFLGLYLVCWPLVYWLATRRTGFSYRPGFLRFLGLGFATALLVSILAKWSELGSLLLGVLAALGFGLYALSRLARMSGVGGRVGRLADALGRLRLWK